MSKLVFAAVVLLAGLALYGALRRRTDGLPPGLRSFAPGSSSASRSACRPSSSSSPCSASFRRATWGVKVLFGQVDPVPLREGLNVVLNPLSSLAPTLIQQQYLSKWDGRLPQYSFGGNAVPLVQIPGLPDGSRR